MIPSFSIPKQEFVSQIPQLNNFSKNRISKEHPSAAFYLQPIDSKPIAKDFTPELINPEMTGFAADGEIDDMVMEDFFDTPPINEIANETIGSQSSKDLPKNNVIVVNFSRPRENRAVIFEKYNLAKRAIDNSSRVVAVASAAINCCPPTQHSSGSAQPATSNTVGGAYGGSEHKTDKHEHCKNCGKDLGDNGACGSCTAYEEAA